MVEVTVHGVWDEIAGLTICRRIRPLEMIAWPTTLFAMDAEEGTAEVAQPEGQFLDSGPVADVDGVSGRAVGFLLAGPLVDAFGLTTAFLALAGPILVIALVCPCIPGLGSSTGRITEGQN